jgi:Flavin reductase like domain
MATSLDVALRPSVADVDFRHFMRHWPTGVAIVTTADADGPVGCTVNALMSLSVEPPLLIVSLCENSRTLEGDPADRPLRRQHPQLGPRRAQRPVRELRARGAVRWPPAARGARRAVARGRGGTGRVRGAGDGAVCRPRPRRRRSGLAVGRPGSRAAAPALRRPPAHHGMIDRALDAVVRASPHYFVSEEQLEAAVSAVSDLICV